MLFYLYQCDSEDCEHAFWSSSDEHTVCPSCGEKSLTATEEANFD